MQISTILLQLLIIAASEAGPLRRARVSERFNRYPYTLSTQEPTAVPKLRWRQLNTGASYSSITVSYAVPTSTTTSEEAPGATSTEAATGTIEELDSDNGGDVYTFHVEHRNAHINHLDSEWSVVQYRIQFDDRLCDRLSHINYISHHNCFKQHNFKQHNFNQHNFKQHNFKQHNFKQHNFKQSHPTGTINTAVPTAIPAPTATGMVDDATFQENIKEAIRLNNIYAGMSNDDLSCISGQAACIQGRFAICNAATGTFTMVTCFPDTTFCYAMPVNYTKGAVLSCEEPETARRVLGTIPPLPTVVHTSKSIPSTVAQTSTALYDSTVTVTASVGTTTVTVQPTSSPAHTTTTTSSPSPSLPDTTVTLGAGGKGTPTTAPAPAITSTFSPTSTLPIPSTPEPTITSTPTTSTPPPLSSSITLPPSFSFSSSSSFSTITTFKSNSRHIFTDRPHTTTTTTLATRVITVPSPSPTNAGNAAKPVEGGGGKSVVLVTVTEKEETTVTTTATTTATVVASAVAGEF
ncbi:hypothetical protein DL546_003424 [Coniochaeta pulveracea]|uniref:Carbohydrate-binding module family 19 domain-containing protein n=1 Tax=Coniochaeta pulveracea TaxID=177199 RepID=A0A420Y038_9PEZI|nr:hypothetical protein DL546_003424 [Coniochaeta pulveracea]